MQAIKGNKKNKIIFYIFSFIFLTTIIFFEKSKVYTTKSIFALSKIEISGYEKINLEGLQLELNNLLGQNLLRIQSKDFENILKKNKLIDEFTIKKQYPNKINIELKEVSFVAIVIKNKKKYFLTDHKKLLLTDNFDLITGTLPFIYGKNTEKHFLTFYNVLNEKEFNFKLIKNYYFFESKRWDIELKNGLIIKFPINELEKAIEISQELIKNKNFNTLSVIDLRIKGKVITKS